ncbi:MAG: PLP-dependent aminotransferase family protein [Halobacteriales archaeon]
MAEDERTGKFDHLFTKTVREGIGEAGYGNWRSVSAPDAASLSFGFPYPDSFPNDELVAAAEAVFEEEGDTALQYGGGEYADHLAEAVAERARMRNMDPDPEDNILLTNGSTHAIDIVCQTFLEHGDDLFVEAPTFMGALALFKNYGVEVSGFPIEEGKGLDVDAVADELATRREEGGPLPKMFYTIPNFQNPSGTTLGIDRREQLLDLAEEYDFVILEDDAYGELRYYGEDVDPLRALDDSGRVIRVSTFSKTICPGVRTGWIIADNEIYEQLRRMSGGGTNTFTQSVLGRYCEEGLLDKNIQTFKQAYKDRRDHMLECLEEYMPETADWTEPDGGFFVWVTLPEGIDAEEMLPTAAEEGVTYLAGHRFYPDDQGRNCLRLSFSHVSFDEMERGIEALGTATRSMMAEA